MEKRFYSLLLLLFISLPLLAQTNKADAYTLKGQVIDSLTNETVPYATLNIADFAPFLRKKHYKKYCFNQVQCP